MEAIKKFKEKRKKDACTTTYVQYVPHLGQSTNNADRDNKVKVQTTRQ